MDIYEYLHKDKQGMVKVLLTKKMKSKSFVRLKDTHFTLV
ncbi:hypothetical protein M948_16720 [Virgibacillus sp. CM-4]|nr:hypothetical protein M948_16720 [Virgibacillus sp. CM-4]